MLSNPPLIFGLLVGVLVLIGFVGLWSVTGGRDPVDDRLAEYGYREELTPNGQARDIGRGQRFRRWFNRLTNGFGLGHRLADTVMQADLPLTASEYVLIVIGAAVLGFLIGTFVLGDIIFGIVLAAVGLVVPGVYVRNRRSKRQRQITEQLPDILTLLVGALRSGYGLSQAIELLVEQLPPPASKEFERVQRATGFGLSLQEALTDMANRVGTDDMSLVVTAINVQSETGGNLATTLDTIGVTIRDRLKLKRDIRVMTSQQRFTGYVLAFLPAALAVIIYLLNPDYMSQLFEPGLVRILPITAVVLQIIGFFVMKKIVDIEV
ncbi:MAG: type II secretion system F family protein, partial [Anaerolineae bacterium]